MNETEFSTPEERTAAFFEQGSETLAQQLVGMRIKSPESDRMIIIDFPQYHDIEVSCGDFPGHSSDLARLLKNDPGYLFIYMSGKHAVPVPRILITARDENLEKIGAYVELEVVEPHNDNFVTIGGAMLQSDMRYCGLYESRGYESRDVATFLEIEPNELFKLKFDDLTSNILTLVPV